MQLNRLCFAAALAVLITSVTWAQQPVSLTATQDAYVNGKQPANNFGSASSIVIHNYGPKIGLVQFDVSSLGDTEIDSAVLRFRLNSLKRDGTINLQPLAAGWQDTTLTYANEPAHAPTAATAFLSTSAIGSVVSVDITDIVKNWHSGTLPNHGLRIQTDESIKAGIDSLESPGTPMQLVVTPATGAGSTTTFFDVVKDTYIIGLQPGNNLGSNDDVIIHNYGPKVGSGAVRYQCASGRDHYRSQPAA